MPAAGVTGSGWIAMARLDRALAQIKTRAVQRRVVGALAKEAKALVREGFQKSRDPFGTPWARGALRRGRPLYKSGAAMRSFTAAVAGFVVTLATDWAWAAVHQEGRTIVPKRPGGLLRFQGTRGRVLWARKVTIPARPMLPPPGVIPPPWTARLEAAADAVIQQVFERLAARAAAARARAA